VRGSSELTASRAKELSGERAVGVTSIRRCLNEKAILIAIWALLAGLALAETAAEKTGVNSTLGIAPTTNDFIQEAAISDMFEIESSKMASAKLAAPEKEFADKMVADHTKTTAELTAEAKADNIPIPPAMELAPKDVG
jgi:putative membrane protein